MIELDHVLPEDIEKTSFSIIKSELEEQGLERPEELAPIILRVIHTTADFEYFDTLKISDGAINAALHAIQNGAHIVTDTTMAYSGINKKLLSRFGGEAHCFIADPDVAETAKKRSVTRASVAIEKAMEIKAPLIFAVGNAPTALISLHEKIEQGFRPELIIGVPVGFVNVVQSKELIMSTDIPYIVNQGRKGGSNVAAAICNALIYMLGR